MSVWQAAQMVLRYSEYADAIAALRTADRESSQQEQQQQEATERAGAGAKEKEVTRKKHLLHMVASLGVGAKDSTLEHFIAVQDTLKNIKEVQIAILVLIVLIVFQAIVLIMYSASL